jgi:hypothetical protein
MGTATAVLPRNLWIEITKGTRGLLPEPKQIIVRSKVKDEAEWFSDDGQSYVILFDKSPFAETRFVVPAGGSVCSGPPKAGASGEYHYGVEAVPKDYTIVPVEPPPAKNMKLMSQPIKGISPCGTIIIHP